MDTLTSALVLLGANAPRTARYTVPLTPRRPRVLIIDDHPLVADGLRHLLGQQYVVVGVLRDGSDAIKAVAEHVPDVVLLDISLQTRSGIDVLRDLVAAFSRLGVIMVTQHTEGVMARLAFSIGARGYVPKDAGVGELHLALREVLAGGRYCSPLIQDDNCPGGGKYGGLLSRLTRRELMIVHLLAKGLTSGQMAERLGVSSWTIHFHRKNIMRKLSVRREAELLVLAAQMQANLGGVEGVDANPDMHCLCGDHAATQDAR